MTSVSVNQIAALIDFLESNRELALGYSNRSMEGRSQARWLWEQCSTVLNSVSANCMRKTPHQWRLYYNEYKSKLLKKIRMLKAEMSDTGGPSESKKITPLQKRLYDLLVCDVGEPLPGVRHNPLVVSQSENSQSIKLEVVQMLNDDIIPVATPEFKPQTRPSGVELSMSQEAIRMPEPSSPTTTPTPRQTVPPTPRQTDSPAPQQTDSPAPRQTVPPASRRRRRRLQRSPRLVNSSKHTTMHETSARLEAMKNIAQATREHAQATHRLAAALEAIGERLREPIVIVLQNPPQAGE